METKFKKMREFFKTIVFALVLAFLPQLLQAGVNITISSDEDIIDIDVNYPSFKKQEVNIDGKTYDRISLEGAGFLNKPGFPMMPKVVALLDISAQNIAGIEVVGSESKTISEFNLLPSPSKEVTVKDGKLYTRDVYSENREAYASDSFFPGMLFEKGESGIIRGESFTQIIFYPIQFNPFSKEIRFFSKIRVRVKLRKESSQEASFRKVGNKKREVQIASFKKAKKTLKITTTDEGIYKITYKDIKKAGFKPTKIKTSTLKLFNKGSECAISILGKKKKYLKKSNSIVFYAEKNQNEYSDENVYWLLWGGAKGKRIASYNGKAVNDISSSPIFFNETLHFEKNNKWVQTVPREEGKDHWMWGDYILASSQGNGTKSVDFDLEGLYHAGSQVVTATVALLGVTTDSSITTDHHTKLYLNGNLIDEFLWDGENEKIITTTFDAGFLSAISNTLSVEEISDQGAKYDAVHLNWFDLSINKKFTAIDNTIKFSFSKTGKHKFNIDGFDKKSVFLFDITDPRNPVKIKANKVKNSDGTYSFSFADTVSSDKTYFENAKKGFRKPSTILSDRNSNLKSTPKGADYIIITHKKFKKSSKALADYRKKEGMIVKIVDVQDIYDEFSYGLFDPQAIRDFLKFAYENWVPKPFYVLIIGDANFDYKDFEKSGTKNYVPTKLVYTSTFGPTPSDNWFVSVDGDDELPDMAIGRIPAKTQEEIDNAIAKIIAYETSPASGNWNQNVIFVADKYDSSAGNFTETSNQIASLLPITYTISKVYLDDYTNSNNKVDIETAQSDLIDEINKGAIMCNFVGHGSLEEWAAVRESESASGKNGTLFSVKTILSLSNSDKLPLILTLDCFNGFFASPDTECLAEEMITVKDNGAVSFIAPSGAGYNWESEIFGKEFVELLFDGNGEKVAGVIFNEAKKNSYGKISVDNINDILLFGDPATKLNLPK
ncbi:MAG: hypothetical protein D6734_06880 [Candidatus Schekmanbacteria bacterium]|nr:MAG: hypothetical protein D6734_06880 [Candidatus Schekmanbacteria bacterium]